MPMTFIALRRSLIDELPLWHWKKRRADRDRACAPHIICDGCGAVYIVDRDILDENWKIRMKDRPWGVAPRTSTGASRTYSRSG